MDTIDNHFKESYNSVVKIENCSRSFFNFAFQYACPALTAVFTITSLAGLVNREYALSCPAAVGGLITGWISFGVKKYLDLRGTDIAYGRVFPKVRQLD